jgi:SAM-dependent methyltransferase
MTPFDDRAFYEKAGTCNGWDFSKVNCVSAGTPTDLYAEVRKLCKKSDLLLDIGAGGGEAVLATAEAVLLVVGIDRSRAMIDTAMKNGAESGLPNVRFLWMDADKLEFPESLFQLVSCRHSPFSAREIARVLVKGGTFLTQQVSETDKANLKQAFGRGQGFGMKPGGLKQRYLTELREAGFRDIRALDWSVTEYYQTAEDLMFLLKHTPIIPDFGQTEEDFLILRQFVQENQTEQGIRTTSDRFLLISTL